MIGPLALLHRRLRRTYYGILAVVAMTTLSYLGVGIGFRANPKVPMDLKWAAPLGITALSLLVLLAMMVFYLMNGSHKARATELLVFSDVDGPKFAAPGGETRFANLPFILGGGLTIQPLMTFPILSPSRDEFMGVALLAPYLVLGVPVLVVGVVGLLRGARRVTLRPGHVELPSVLGARKVAWTRLAPGGPLQPWRPTGPIEVRFTGPAGMVRFFSGVVEPRFLADVIRHYVEHPEYRAQIGTPAEYERLREALLG